MTRVKVRPATKKNMSTSERFWFGHIDDRRGGSVVIWDRLSPHLPDDLVYLFHFKRNAIVKFRKDMVRDKLRPITREEESVIDAALSKYFEARSRLSRDLWTEKIEKHVQCAESSNSDVPSELLERMECFYCEGRGFDYGNLCPVCSGWGELCD
jgi:hypothetical protein